MRTALASAVCLTVFALTLAISSILILAVGGVRMFLLQALLKPAISALVAIYTVEKAFKLDNLMPFYTLSAAIIAFMGYLQIGRHDVLAAYNLFATGTFTVISIGASYLTVQRLRRQRS